METKILTKNQLSEAAAIIQNGGIVVMPTETVYGLAADAYNPQAVQKIFTAKGRQSDNPLIVHIANIADWRELVEDIKPEARLLAERFWPGPLTIILKKSDKVPAVVSGGLDTVAVRMPKNKIAFRFIKECGVPIAAPSANLSGAPSPTKFSHVLQDMNGRVDAIIDGGDCMVGIESTVISLAEDIPTILRPGRITAKQIRKVIGEVRIHPAVNRAVENDEQALSPGMKYKHYAPQAEVTLIQGDDAAFIRHIEEHADDATAVICYSEQMPQLGRFHCFNIGSKKDSITQAKRIFDVLRTIDKQGLTRAFAPLPDDDGVGLAVQNRLLRAAGFSVIQLEPENLPGEASPAEKEENISIAVALPIEQEEPTESELNALIPGEPAEEPPAPPEPPVEEEPEPVFITTEEEPDEEEAEPEEETTFADADNHIAFTVTPATSQSDEESEEDVLSHFDILEEDSAILALSDVKLGEDFNEDFSKEISDRITIVEKTDEDDPTKIFYEASLDENGAIPAAYPVDSIGDDFQFDVYDDDIEAERNRSLFGFLWRRKRRKELEEVEPEPFIPARNPVWNADKPLRGDDAAEDVIVPAPSKGAMKPIYGRIEGLRVIGLTGKSGAGKTYIAKKLAAKAKKSAIIDADALYHSMLKTDSMILSLVVAFGNEILDGKSVNRKKLAEIVFSSAENLEKLNQTVLPQVAEEVIKLLHHAKDKGLETVFIDAPTLIESNLYQVCNEVIFVVADAAIRQERIVLRDNITLDEIGQRMRFEKPDAFYVRYADRIIRND